MYRVPILESFSFQKQALDFKETLPETTASRGHRYIFVPSDENENKNKIAWCDGKVWKYDTPEKGWLIYIGGENAGLYLFNGTAWNKFNASDLGLDTTNFTGKFPKTVKTLQELLEWLDKNVNSDGVVGTPSDTSFKDGLLDWTETTKIADAFDETNEILAELAPPQARSLYNIELKNSITSTGKVPQGLSPDWAGAVPGQNIKVTTLRNHVFELPNKAEAFNKGDEGFLIGKSSHGSANSLTQFAKINIGANFQDAIPGVSSRPISQDLTKWNLKTKEGFVSEDADTPVTGGSHPGTAYCEVTKETDTLRITEVTKHNNFNKWQRMNAEIRVNNLADGNHQFQMVHSLPRGDAESAKLNFYVDTDNTPLSVSNLTLTPKTPVYKNVSGVKYYAQGSTFNLTATINNIYSKIYNASSVGSVSMDGHAGNINITPDSDPQYNASKDVNLDGQLVIGPNVYNIEAKAYLQTNHPYKTLGRQQTSSIMINSYSTNRNTATESFWSDDSRRLKLDFDMSSKPDVGDATLTNGNWNSEDQLGNNDALIYNNQLMYGNIDLSNQVPAGPNYSNRAGDKKYVRAFNIGMAKSGMFLTCPGLVDNDVKPLGQGNVNIEIKLPGLSGWCDCGKIFNAVEFSGQPKDNAGVKAGNAQGSKFNITFGGLNATDTNGWVLVRITFRNATKSINGTLVAAGK